MPRYFFNIRNGAKVVADPEGVELSSLQTARSEALDAAREILAGKVRRGETIDGQVFEICDASGNTLLNVPFRSALKLD